MLKLYHVTLVTLASQALVQVLENVLGSLSKLQLLGRACASDLSKHIQVRGAFHSVSR